MAKATSDGIQLAARGLTFLEANMKSLILNLIVLLFFSHLSQAANTVSCTGHGDDSVSCDDGATCDFSSDSISCDNGNSCSSSGADISCNNGLTCTISGTTTDSSTISCDDGSLCIIGDGALSCVNGKGPF